MNSGIPMDLSVHLAPITADQAARTLEWQKVRFESARSMSFRKGRSLSPEAEIALEDVTRLRDDVQRGRERLFHSSLSLTLPCRRSQGAEGDDPEDQGPLCRHPGQARRPAIPPEGGAPLNAAHQPQRRGNVEEPGHLLPGAAVSLFSPRHGHPQRHSLRPGPEGPGAHRLRPLGRHPPERPTPPSWPARAAENPSPPSWEYCGVYAAE